MQGASPSAAAPLTGLLPDCEVVAEEVLLLNSKLSCPECGQSFRPGFNTCLGCDAPLSREGAVAALVLGTEPGAPPSLRWKRNKARRGLGSSKPLVHAGAGNWPKAYSTRAKQHINRSEQLRFSSIADRYERGTLYNDAMARERLKRTRRHILNHWRGGAMTTSTLTSLPGSHLALTPPSSLTCTATARSTLWTS